MKLTARLILTAALMLSIGLHWNVLQVAAWVNMIRDYSAQQGLVQGVIMTFDGENPCPMCLKIASGKAAQEPQSQKTGKQDHKTDNSLKNPTDWTHTDKEKPKLPYGDTASTMPQVEVLLMKNQWQDSPVTPPPRCGAV